MRALGGARSRETALRGYIALVVAGTGAGVALLLADPFAIAGATQWNWTLLAALAVAAVAAERARIDLFGESHVSLSFVPLFAAALLLGPVPGALAAATATLVARAPDRGAWHRLLFNASVITASTAAGGAVFHAMAGAPDTETIVPQAAAAALAALVAFLASSGLGAAAVAITDTRSLLEVWGEKYRWLAPYHVALGLAAYAMSAGYVTLGGAGLAIFALPLALLWLSLMQYASRARGDNVRLREANAAVQISEERFSALVQNASGMVIVVDGDGAVRYLSPPQPGQPADGAATGAAAGNVPGANLASLVHPEDVERARACLREVTQRADGEATTELRMRDQDGEWRSFEARFANLTENLAVRGIVINARDVTERRQLEDRLLVAQKTEALGTLVAGVAHDFNNLLTTIGGSIEQARNEPSDGRWLDSAGLAVERSAALVQNLLLHARRAEPQRAGLSVVEIARQTVALVRETFDRRITVDLSADQDLPPVHADAGQIQQVLLNLLVNARDAVMERLEGAPGGYSPRIAIVVRAAEDGDGSSPEAGGQSRVLLTVTDNGSGMTPEIRERIFDPFFSTKQPGAGTGLGLSTAYGIVAEHGGTLAVRSEQGRSTTFTVTLPASTGAASEQAERAEAVPHAVPDGPGATLLLVDDERAILSLGEAVLSSAGYTVVLASSGDEALRAIEQQTFDLAVVDVNMPAPNGWEVLERIRALSPATSVLMSSGYASIQDARTRGAHGLIDKPYSSSELVLAIRETLSRHSAR